MAPTEETNTSLPSVTFIGPEVVVKNTFIEVKLDEESTPLPRSQQHRRAKTLPQATFDGFSTTEDEVTDSDVAVSNFVSEDGTSEQEEQVALVRAATEQLGARAEASPPLQPPPQFSSGDLKVIVKNTFLDVDLATPSARRTARSKTAPNKQSFTFTDLGLQETEYQDGCGGIIAGSDDGSTSHKAESTQEEEEEEEIELPVERFVTMDWYESPCMVDSAQEQEEEEGETEPPVERIVTQDWYDSPQAWEWVPGMRMPLEPCMVRPTIDVSTLIQAQPPEAEPAAQSAAQPTDASLSHTSAAPSVPAATDKQEQSPQIQVQMPPFIPEAVSLSNSDSGFFRVHWTVDARKLRGNDKQVVSPPFELALGPNSSSVPFKMMIYPKIANGTRPGVSFKTSGGAGYIQLKCDAELSQSVAGVVLRLSLGDGADAAKAPPRGPVLHDFLSSGVCGLPRGQEIWDFSSAVDKSSMTFCICLEIAPSRGA